MQALKQAITELTDAGALLFPCNALEKGVLETVEISTPVDLESDYVGLFELNQQNPPLHLNAHLYLDSERNLIPLRRRLQELYQSFGMELKLDAGAEQPDHLTVELEFLAYLYNECVRAGVGEGKWPLEKVSDGITSIQKELSWVPAFVNQLEHRSNHPFYVPLGRFLVAVLGAGQG